MAPDRAARLFRRVAGKRRDGCCNEVDVAVSQAPVGQNRRVLYTGPDAVPTRDGSPIDRPGCDAVAMVHLFERDARVSERPFDRVCMSPSCRCLSATGQRYRRRSSAASLQEEQADRVGDAADDAELAVHAGVAGTADRDQGAQDRRDTHHDRGNGRGVPI